MTLIEEKALIQVLKNDKAHLEGLVDSYAKVLSDIKCALPDGKKLRINEIAQKVGQLAAIAKEKEND